MHFYIEKMPNDFPDKSNFQLQTNASVQYNNICDNKMLKMAAKNKLILINSIYF